MASKRGIAIGAGLRLLLISGAVYLAIARWKAVTGPEPDAPRAVGPLFNLTWWK